VLFKDTFITGIRNGSIDRTVRRWRTPRARIGGSYRIRPGLTITVTALAEISHRAITNDDARRSGFETRAALLTALDGDGKVYRIDFVRTATKPTSTPTLNKQEIITKLDAMDRRAAGGAWTRAVLRLIADHPGRRAGDLAPRVGLALPEFKARVRRLKAIGLTESLETGYRLTPQGRTAVRGSKEPRRGAR